MTIIKVQRPLMTNGDEPQWLLYDKARKHQELLPEKLVPKNVGTAMGGDYKAFFNAEWSSIVGWGISDRVKDQTW
jgi:hypothetical protein